MNRPRFRPAAALLPGLLALGGLLAAEPPAPLPAAIESPRLVVRKAQRQLLVYSGETLLKTYRVGLGGNPVPPKERQGDLATPEGSYVVCIRNPRSQFLLSLGLTYPNAADADRGLKAGLVTRSQHRRIVEAARTGACPPWNTALGGEIFIHGRGSATDWTWGCVALDDDDMRELYSRIPVGTPVVIEP
ncbi:MAG: L,D-transpeptidase [Thermoanaerobaculia bacterium]|nr:L,D-transpeptidase [Thermoanaerobaculia bacterium]